MRCAPAAAPMGQQDDHPHRPSDPTNARRFQGHACPSSGPQRPDAGKYLLPVLQIALLSAEGGGMLGTEVIVKGGLVQVVDKFPAAKGVIDLPRGHGLGGQIQLVQPQLQPPADVAPQLGQMIKLIAGAAVGKVQGGEANPAEGRLQCLTLRAPPAPGTCKIRFPGADSSPGSGAPARPAPPAWPG